MGLEERGESAPHWSGRHADKDALRAEIWATLKANHATRRDPVGHIPNFVDAEQAAEQLAKLPIWQNARVIKCNPDSPQSPIRRRALEEGKCLYMAVPRLTNARCFVELTAEALRDRNISLRDAASMRNALIYGKKVSFAEMQPIDLLVVGCVAVTPTGGRTGKGAGFADLELAMLRQFGLITPETPIVTTVHSLQVVESDRLPMQPHDWPLDWVVTSEGAIATQTAYPRPQGLDWDALQPDQLKQIPILKRLKADHETSQSL